jgi:quercetin dioxygenase-like cupin family protein
VDVSEIFRVDEAAVPWVGYRDHGERAVSGGPDGPPASAVRFKALSHLGTDVPSMQYVDYPPDHLDPVHSHDTGEWLILTEGEMWMEGDAETVSRAGSAVYVPKDTPYAIHSGRQGVRFFRIVVA